MTGYLLPKQSPCKAGESREKSGRCVTNLVLTPAATTEAAARVLPGQVGRSKLLYTAVRAPPLEEQQSGRKGSEGLNEKGFAEADMAVLSIEGELHGLASVRQLWTAM